MHIRLRAADARAHMNDVKESWTPHADRSHLAARSSISRSMIDFVSCADDLRFVNAKITPLSPAILLN